MLNNGFFVHMEQRNVEVNKKQRHASIIRPYKGKVEVLIKEYNKFDTLEYRVLLSAVKWNENVCMCMLVNFIKFWIVYP